MAINSTGSDTSSWLIKTQRRGLKSGPVCTKEGGFSAADKSVFVELGCGIGRVLWHVAFALNSQERTAGIELRESLEAEFQELARMVRAGAQEASITTFENEEFTPEVTHL